VRGREIHDEFGVFGAAIVICIDVWEKGEC